MVPFVWSSGGPGIESALPRHHEPHSGPELAEQPPMTRTPYTISLVAWLGVAWLSFGADAPAVVPVWPGKAPEEDGKIGPEPVRMSPKFTRKEVEVTEPTRL